MLEVLAILACLSIAFSIGSNDTSNAFGVCIGCRIINFRTANLLLLLFAFIGCIAGGEKVMTTVGKDLVEFNLILLVSSLTVAASIIVFSNARSFPVSSHQVIVGSLVGAGFASGAYLELNILKNIILSWVLSPIVAILVAAGVFFLVKKIFSGFSILKINRIFKILLLLNSVLIAYNTGANELATALGAVVYFGLIDHFTAAFLGSIFLWLGAKMLSWRVIETVGKGIAPLDPASGFSAQFGAALTVLIFTLLRMPVYTTYCIVGGVFGVGIVGKMGTVKREKVRSIVFNWILSPTVAFLFSSSAIIFLNLVS
ncbi:MAG: inorganic phosphate transporter [Archaeoglobaceae archaeon]